MLEFPIKRTIIIDDSKKKKGRKKKGDGEKTVIRGTVNLPKKEPLKKLDKLPKNAKNLVIVESPAKPRPSNGSSAAAIRSWPAAGTCATCRATSSASISKKVSCRPIPICGISVNSSTTCRKNTSVRKSLSGN